MFGQYNSFLRKKYVLCCVLIGGYEEQSTKYHEHKLASSVRKVSAAIEKVHTDQLAFCSNEKNETNFSCRLTTHRDIGRHLEVSRGNADILIGCA